MEDKTNISITWKEFKAFFYQSLAEFEAFVNVIWNIIWKNSQHQLEEVMDCIAHLRYLQIVFQEFNADTIISERVLICLFRNGLRLFIRKAKQDGCQKDTWE